jgi:hypothetical protein
LTRIEACAFRGCLELKSILIPPSIEELSSGWARDSSLHLLIFESALSLRRMCETGKVDLSPLLEIKIVQCDCALEFPGYSIHTVSGDKECFRLLKGPLQEHK